MTVTSATGGYVIPSPRPSRDGIIDGIGDMIAGVTGIARDLVRPRDQANPPKHPALDQIWVSFGIRSMTPDGGQLIAHRKGKDAQVVRSDALDVLVTIYGPDASDYATALADGLMVPQNRAELRRFALAVVNVGGAVSLSEPLGGSTLKRVDVPLVLRQGTPSGAGIVQIEALEPGEMNVKGDVT